MKSVMHFTATRILCHDDIRAIRMVYGSKPKRENAKYDDTCRRDFPIGFLQKLMRLIARAIIFGAILFSIISTSLFLLILLYLLLRYLIRKRSTTSEKEAPSPVNTRKTRNVLPRGYLYHDEML